jgi:Holliday junction DNA helicase RuvA
MLLLDVQGVGYELEAPMTTFYKLPDTGAAVTLHTHLLVREDAQLLYAFSDLGQRDLFRTLLRVNGVGPRVALAILSGLSVEELHACVLHGDTAALIRVPGIGRKTAERLLVEMRDRLTPPDGADAAAPGVAGDAGVTPARDAVSALVALGYKAIDAARAVRPLENQGLSREDMIRRALQIMGARTS